MDSATYKMTPLASATIITVVLLVWKNNSSIAVDQIGKLFCNMGKPNGKAIGLRGFDHAVIDSGMTPAVRNHDAVADNRITRVDSEYNHITILYEKRKIVKKSGGKSR